VIRRGTRGFARAARVYNERFDGVTPLLVARPVDAIDVRDAVRWAVAAGVPLRARSGGHSYAGYSTIADGVVLDLRELTGIAVDAPALTATVGAGCQLIDVYTALAAHGLTIPAGSCPSVGVSGHALGGGMGLAARRFGLTADNLLGARIVTADGRLRTVGGSGADDPDLFWALRGGGGGNFGVVTSFQFRVHPVPPTVATFFVSWPWSLAADALGAWQEWAPHSTPLATSIFHLKTDHATTSVNVSGQYFGPAADLDALLAPLRAVGGSVFGGDFGYLQAQIDAAGCAALTLQACHTAGTRPGGTLPRDSFQAKSDYVAAPLPAAARATLVAAVAQRALAPGHGAVLLDCYGGAINQVAADATAFVHRDDLFCMQYLSYEGDGGWLASTAGAMTPFVTGRSYVNYTDPTLADWQSAYYGANYRRLLEVRRAVDPDHFFTFPQAIGR
jgi:FAD/FMN-containing dehydrogenase